MKNIRTFYLKIFLFFSCKFSIYLNRHVFVMTYSIQSHSKVREPDALDKSFRHFRQERVGEWGRGRGGALF